MRPAMITGCNTNVLYRGKQFHVQTEDSGRGKPHIISHVYHGGTIIASEKSSYAHRVDADELDIKVRAQIELQHKSMLKRLTHGELDAVIDERLGGGVAPAKPTPAPAAKKPAAQSKPSTGDTSGSVTANAATDPSIDPERPAADTKPIIDDPAAAAFGSSADSEKPLDEVILEYLVDKARDRASDKKRPSARQPRQKG
ncbi:MAG: hypothetical protein JRE38_09565 [Deltaproteobacteria bacterium]|nr:hypothetical protein [Deltaproteobacteria bacterium]